MRLDQFISSNEPIKKTETDKNKVSNSVVKFLTILLQDLKKNIHYDINFERRGEQYYFQSMSASRVVFVTGMIRLPNNLPEKFYMYFDDLYDPQHMSITDILSNIRTEDEKNKITIFTEPEIEFTTTVIAKVKPLYKILKEYSYFDRMLFKPLPNHTVKLLLRNYYSDGYATGIEDYNIRAIEGSDPGLYGSDYLRDYLRLLKDLGINTIKLQYATNKPMLITPRNPYPQIRVWVAPAMVEE